MKAHAEITAKIIAQMETAGSNWLNPMTGDGFGLPRNAVSGHRYQGINVLILGFTGSYIFSQTYAAPCSSWPSSAPWP